MTASVLHSLLPSYSLTHLTPEPWSLQSTLILPCGRSLFLSVICCVSPCLHFHHLWIFCMFQPSKPEPSHFLLVYLLAYFYQNYYPALFDTVLTHPLVSPDFCVQCPTTRFGIWYNFLIYCLVLVLQTPCSLPDVYIVITSFISILLF